MARADPGPVARPAGRADVPELARLHRLVFPSYASSVLGPAHCRRLLGTYLHHPDALVLVVDGGGGPVGYLVGAPAAVQREVDRSLRVRAAVTAGARLLHPSTWVWAAARRRARRSTRAAAPPAPDGPAATVRVVLVGVAPSARGGGVVDALLGAFASEARDRGHHHAELVVDPGNGAAHRAYARCGWEPVGAPPTRFRLAL